MYKFQRIRALVSILKHYLDIKNSVHKNKNGISSTLIRLNRQIYLLNQNWFFVEEKK